MGAGEHARQHHRACNRMRYCARMGAMASATLLHEMLHVLVEAEAGERTPLWLREGLVETVGRRRPVAALGSAMPVNADRLCAARCEFAAGERACTSRCGGAGASAGCPLWVIGGARLALVRRACRAWHRARSDSRTHAARIASRKHTTIASTSAARLRRSTRLISSTRRPWPGVHLSNEPASNVAMIVPRTTAIQYVRQRSARSMAPSGRRSQCRRRQRGR